MKDESYLQKFGNLVYENLISLIDETASIQSSKLNYSDLINELLMHAKLCNSMLESYQPREHFYEIIYNYVTGDNMFPFVVFGEYGSGKTSILAQLIKNVCIREDYETRLLNSELANNYLAECISRILLKEKYSLYDVKFKFKPIFYSKFSFNMNFLIIYTHTLE